MARNPPRGMIQPEIDLAATLAESIGDGIAPDSQAATLLLDLCLTNRHRHPLGPAARTTLIRLGRRHLGLMNELVRAVESAGRHYAGEPPLTTHRQGEDRS